MKIEKEILDIIDSGTSDGNTYYLPPKQLDRNTYLKVNKVLEILGGKWDRKSKGHIFESPIDDRIENVVLMGEITDHKKELNFFETPCEIVKQICELAQIEQNLKVLEPSAGKGAIINEIQHYTNNILWSEIDDDLASHITIGQRIGKDFLEVNPSDFQVDRVVMNPPFSKQQDIDHVTHALEFIEHGILVSIMSPSIKFRTNKKTTTFLKKINEFEHTIIDLPEGSFKSSGTMVNTIILVVYK
jgi:type I restriction-modification system DNA methylase subunit